MRMNLKLFRVERNLSQKKMAELLGVSYVTYSYIELGKRVGRPKFWRNLQNVFSVADEDMYSLMKTE